MAGRPAGPESVGPSLGSGCSGLRLAFAVVIVYGLLLCGRDALRALALSAEEQGWKLPAWRFISTGPMATTLTIWLLSPAPALPFVARGQRTTTYLGVLRLTGLGFGVSFLGVAMVVALESFSGTAELAPLGWWLLWPCVWLVRWRRAAGIAGPSRIPAIALAMIVTFSAVETLLARDWVIRQPPFMEWID